jgi:CRP/FNR family transcriptional regulator, cyclic AMP receptor protein
MMTLERAKGVVASRGWLSQTGAGFRDAVLARVSLRSYRSGDTIYSINDPPGGMYGLAAGGAKVSSAQDEDGPYVAHIMTPGDWTGYGPAITGGNRIIGLTAGRNCQLLSLPLHAVEEILAGDPESWRHLALLALIDTQIALGAMEDLAIRDEFRRFLAVLLRAGGSRYGDPNGDVPIRIDLNQTDLAHMCNLSRNTVGAFLRSLEGEGLIETGYGVIGIRKPTALRGRLARDV